MSPLIYGKPMCRSVHRIALVRQEPAWRPHWAGGSTACHLLQSMMLRSLQLLKFSMPPCWCMAMSRVWTVSSANCSVFLFLSADSAFWKRPSTSTPRTVTDEHNTTDIGRGSHQCELPQVITTSRMHADVGVLSWWSYHCCLASDIAEIATGTLPSYHWDSL